MKIIFKLQQNT